MKSTMRKTLSVILSVVLVLANVSLIAFANDTTTPEYTTSEDIVGYSAARVERVDLTNIPSITERPNDFAGKYTSWKISTVAELQFFAASPTKEDTYAGETIYLANDIDLTGVDFVPFGGWATTGDAAWAKIHFRGTFDGQGYVIKNMKITMPSEGITAANGYVGFFRNLGTGAVVKNVVFDENCVVSCGTNVAAGPMGILAGSIDPNKSYNTDLTTDTVTISNCFIQGQLIHGGGVAGGIAPYAKSAAVTIENCTNAADLIPAEASAEKSQNWNGSRGVGGILGMVGEGTTCSATNFIKVIPVTVSITNCRNTGKIVGGKAPAGGIVGTMTSLGRPAGIVGSGTTYEGQISESSGETKTLTIDGCINNGEIGYVIDTTSAQGLGGILGLNMGNGANHLVTIKNSKNYGTIVEAPQVTPETLPATNPGALVNEITSDYAHEEGKEQTIAAVLTDNTAAAGQTDSTKEQALWQDQVAIADPEPTPTPGGDTPSGDTPSGDTPSGDTPSGDTPSGDTPSGDTPSGDTNNDTNNTETKAPETQAPTTTEEKKSGCGATVALIPVMMVTLGAAAVALKKKED